MSENMSETDVVNDCFPCLKAWAWLLKKHSYIPNRRYVPDRIQSDDVYLDAVGSDVHELYGPQPHECISGIVINTSIEPYKISHDKEKTWRDMSEKEFMYMLLFLKSIRLWAYRSKLESV